LEQPPPANSPVPRTPTGQCTQNGRGRIYGLVLTEGSTMSTEARVGAFVIVGLLVLGSAIYFIRTTQTVRGQARYKTYLRYAGGLDPGAPVLFGGIKVGRVAAVRPASE